LKRLRHRRRHEPDFLCARYSYLRYLRHLPSICAA
jgi:hypothetical protein